jgi:hypothetical protein
MLVVFHWIMYRGYVNWWLEKRECAGKKEESKYVPIKSF